MNLQASLAIAASTAENGNRSCSSRGCSPSVSARISSCRVARVRADECAIEEADDQRRGVRIEQMPGRMLLEVAEVLRRWGGEGAPARH